LRYPTFGWAPAFDGTTAPTAFILALTRTSLGLEAWEQPLDTLASGVTPRHVWFHANGELIIFAR
jgi:hypothetical protein